MITPAEFVTRWQTEVVAKDPMSEDMQLVSVLVASVTDLPLTAETKQFLTQAGLPNSCAPCITFDELAKGLVHIWEEYSPGQWSEEEKRGIETYRIMGSDGAGSPICLDERDGRVVLLDHELLFDLNRRQSGVTLINSSVPQLAESLLIFATIPGEMIMNALSAIDPPAMRRDAFWFREARPKKSPWWRFW